MSFIINSQTLLKELQKEAGVVTGSKSLPILDHFLFELEGNLLKITGTDLENTIFVNVEIEGNENARFCVPSKLLLDILKAQNNQPLSFNYNEETYLLEIKSDNGNYKIPCMDADEFPKTAPLENEEYIEINSLVLANAIEKTIFATGDDDLRPVMNGVYFQFDGNGASFAATDAHKLVLFHRKDVHSQKPVAFIMPKKPLNLLKSILSLIDENIRIYYNEKNAMFTMQNTTLICRLIEGKYPNYEAVIPKNNPNVLLIDRKLLLESIKRVSLFSNKTTHQVLFQIKGNKLVISGEDHDLNYQAKEELPCQYDGQDMQIGFNAKFLIEMLSRLDSENVKLSMSTPNKPGILTPGDNLDENEDILMLVMPIMIQAPAA